MFKLFAAGTLCIFISILAPQTTFALGKTAYVMTCKPGNLGEVVIEPMVYDYARTLTFDDVPQFNDRNFFDLKPGTKEKLSEPLIAGNVIKKEFRWKGRTLIGYLEESASDTLPKEKRSLTEIVPQNENSHRAPGSVVTMEIEDTNISCEFTTPKNIYTKISVDFYQAEPNPSNTCNSNEDVKSLRVNWHTKKGKVAIKTADILMSCGHKGGPLYNVSRAKITTIGTVTVNLHQTKELQHADKLLYQRRSNKLPRDDDP